MKRMEQRPSIPVSYERPRRGLWEGVDGHPGSISKRGIPVGLRLIQRGKELWIPTVRPPRVTRLDGICTTSSQSVVSTLTSVGHGGVQSPQSHRTEQEHQTLEVCHSITWGLYIPRLGDLPISS